MPGRVMKKKLKNLRDLQLTYFRNCVIIVSKECYRTPITFSHFGQDFQKIGELRIVSALVCILPMCLCCQNKTPIKAKFGNDLIAVNFILWVFGDLRVTVASLTEQCRALPCSPSRHFHLMSPVCSRFPHFHSHTFVGVLLRKRFHL